MIYLVSNNKELQKSNLYKCISLKESLGLLNSWQVIQVDTETTGRDAHINTLLCVQFGNDKADTQIVVDCTTIDIKEYKQILESKFLVLQNAKFDIQFFYSYGIIPRNVYDTMIVEQLLYLGYPSGQISYSLKAIAERRLNICLDKTVRGEIIWRGLDERVIEYAASDVKHLQQIMKLQLEDCKKQGLYKAAEIECKFVPAIAYLEWCGIHLDANKWKAKMQKDSENLEESIKALNAFVIKTPSLKQFTFIDTQGNLFTGFNLEPQVTINWASSQQVVQVAKILGFNTTTQDKKTGEDKDSVMEKHLKSQKGINDEFLKLYFGKGNPGDEDYYPGYSGSAKVVSSFGQGHLNAINPKTNRIHTQYRQLGASSGRMSCGSQQPNNDLAKLKGISPKECTYPNMQQLPSDEETRSCFTAPDGYLWCACDFSALESRLGADIYNEKSMLDEFLQGSGDMHSLCAYMVYDEIPRDTPIKDIKKLYPHLRKAVKGIELSSEDSL